MVSVHELSYAEDSKKASGAAIVVFDICHTFFDTLLQDICPADVRARLSTLTVIDALEHRRATSMNELENLIRDKEYFPSLYNHYYTETVQNCHKAQVETGLTWCIENTTVAIWIGASQVTPPKSMSML